MPTKFSCLAAAWDLAPCPHFHYLPNDLLHHQAGDRKGKVSNFRWLRDRKIGNTVQNLGYIWVSMSKTQLSVLILFMPFLLFKGYSDESKVNFHFNLSHWKVIWVQKMHFLLFQITMMCDKINLKNANKSIISPWVQKYIWKPIEKVKNIAN